jgi:hypothetical protein
MYGKFLATFSPMIPRKSVALLCTAVALLR